MNKRAVLYIRVSTDEQAKYGYSIDMQQNQCLNFALKEGYDVIDTYIDDGYSAKNIIRPQFQKLLQDIKKTSNHIEAVIVWRCDRMIRNNSLYHSTIVPKFAKYGVLLLSATENNDVNNPYGRYIRNTQINNAELESELTSIRTKENLKEKARQGYFPGSIPPVGYIRIKVDGKKIIVPDKEPEEKTSPAAIVAVLLLIGLLGAMAFFFLKGKIPNTQTKGDTNLDDYDYGIEDDEEYADFEEYEEEEEK